MEETLTSAFVNLKLAAEHRPSALTIKQKRICIEFGFWFDSHNRGQDKRVEGIEMVYCFLFATNESPNVSLLLITKWLLVLSWSTIAMRIFDAASPSLA